MSIAESKQLRSEEEMLTVLKELVELHKNWFRGTAYVSVKFEQENDAVIARAREVIRRNK